MTLVHMVGALPLVKWVSLSGAFSLAYVSLHESWKDNRLTASTEDQGIQNIA